jgi:hypothetical protein
MTRSKKPVEASPSKNSPLGRRVSALAGALSALGIAASIVLSPATAAAAQNQIIRPFAGIRSLGMGGTRITTGLYEDNFFGNPARIAANPKWKLQLFDLSTESTPGTLKNLGSLLSNTDDALSELGQSAGTNNHVRAQLVLPALYLPNLGKMSVAFGLLSSVQADLLVRRSYQVNPLVISDIGPVLQVARRFLENDALVIGASLRASYRVASESGFSFADLIRGQNLDLSSGGDGGLIDGDLGATYELPWSWKEWKFSTGASLTHLLGGQFSSFDLGLISGTSLPPAQRRSFHWGVSARRDTLWKFADTILALELTDIGNNVGGSVFRTVHLGGETRYGILRLRAGLNQGYLAGGLGVDLRFAAIDFATYGEEMSLNSGGAQDRRIALRVGFRI